MIPTKGYGLAGLLALAAVTGFDPGVVSAQSAPPSSLTDRPLPSPPATNPWAIDGAAPEVLEGQASVYADADELDWSQIDVDSTTPSSLTAKPRTASRPASTGDLAWSSKDKPNGSDVSVKQPISSFWDTRAGADMTIVRQPTTLAELLAEKAANGGYDPQSSGSAWVAATAPGIGSIWDKTAVEARFNPSQDQGKLGTSLSKSLSLGEQYSLTLQNGYSMTQQGFASTAGTTTRTTYATEQSAKLGVTETGTSFSAGQSLSTNDDRWLRRIGAEQKIVGGFNISASVAETALGPANKSISAGFKQSW